MPKRTLIAIVAFFAALAALVVIVLNRQDGDDFSSANLARKKEEPVKLEPAPDTGKVQPYPSGMMPGEVAPGPRPGTVVVQPLSPDDPKVISTNYRVPTPDQDPRVDRTEDGQLVFNAALEMARRLHDPGSNPEEDLKLLDNILGFYRMIYRQNPVAGSNADVIRALQGKNPQKVVVFPGTHPFLNDEGELVDRWEIPYYFHALSRDNMDIWSAGPDTKFGTLDDLKLGAEDEKLQLHGDAD